MKKAVISSGIVTNIIEVDESAIPDWCIGLPDATDDAFIGGSYVNGQFLPPAPAAITEQQTELMRSSLMISFAQLLIGLVSESFITEQEAELWLQGQLPQPVLAIIDTLPLASRFAAKVKATRPSEVLRADPIVWAMADSKGMTPEQLDQFFIKYSAV